MCIRDRVIEGSVSDKITGIRLSGVNIIIVDKNAGSSTDSNGEFSLDTKDLNSSQIIQFKHIGYDQFRISLDSLMSQSNILLQPRVLQFGAIETSWIKRKPAIEKDLPQTVSIIQSDAFALRAYVDAGDLLATDQSVQIEESLSGRKTVSIRGGNADDVLVLYNGFRLNRPYDNVFDLSLIDMQNIEQIEIHNKTYLHIKHSTHQKNKFHIKVLIKSEYLQNEKKLDTTKKVYKILDYEIKEYIHSIQLKIN